jgi:hypothetical protein
MPAGGSTQRSSAPPAPIAGASSRHPGLGKRIALAVLVVLAVAAVFFLIGYVVGLQLAVVAGVA